MGSVARWCVAGVLATCFSGCVFLDVLDQQAQSEAAVRLEGRIELEQPEASPLVALLIRWPADGAAPQLVDHVVLRRSGPFYFSVATPGTYSVAAFVDRNRNLAVDAGEPARRTTPDTTFELAAGETASGIQIVVSPDERIDLVESLDIRLLEQIAIEDRVGATMGQLGVVGDVVSLDDERFRRENGELGLWRPFDFLLEVGAGIYFLEPYDPGRTPVLFVHGIGGNPREFATLIDGLDRTRFQPWVFFYPSGGKLDRIAEYLSRAMADLELVHGFRQLHVVAHSMGGLVSRGFLLHYTETRGSTAPRLFLSLSTPWEGHASAKLGVDYAPAVVYSWVDVAPGSDFLQGLFYRGPEERRRLPDFVDHHLLFGFRRDHGVPGICTDKVVSVASELRPEAQDEAATTFGYDADHTGILLLPEAVERVNRLLAEASPD